MNLKELEEIIDIRDGHVICKMLGYPDGAESVYHTSKFGHANLEFHLDNLMCIGDEDTFLKCGNNGWGKHNCGLSETAGVTCKPKKSEYYTWTICNNYLHMYLLFIALITGTTTATTTSTTTTTSSKSFLLDFEPIFI